MNLPPFLLAVKPFTSTLTPPPLPDPVAAQWWRALQARRDELARLEGLEGSPDTNPWSVGAGWLAARLDLPPGRVLAMPAQVVHRWLRRELGGLATLWAWARDHLKRDELAAVELLVQSGGECALADLAHTLQWWGSPDYSWGGLRHRLKGKLGSQGWTVRRQGGRIILAGEPKRAQSARDRHPPDVAE